MTLMGLCPLLARSGRCHRAEQCLLLGAKRTSMGGSPMSGFDPKRTSATLPQNKTPAMRAGSISHYRCRDNSAIPPTTTAIQSNRQPLLQTLRHLAVLAPNAGCRGMGASGACRPGWLGPTTGVQLSFPSENHCVAGDATSAYSFGVFLICLSLSISDKRADDTHADESHGRYYTRPCDPFFVLHLPRFQALAGDRPVHWRCQQIAIRFSQVTTELIQERRI
jgi:hypothetical protein